MDKYVWKQSHQNSFYLYKNDILIGLWNVDSKQYKEYNTKTDKWSDWFLQVYPEGAGEPN